MIDSDQGQSGRSAADREGFQRLVADVGLGKAGIVLGLEVSRLARNNADWHRLLEISALAGTLICDEDGLYDPADFNDRLLLGLKGTMSEAELHFIRARLQGGDPVAAARRGELPMPLPVGLVTDAAGKLVIDPDRAVQDALRLLFATFQRTGSARAVVYAFQRDGLLFPSRIRKGPRKGELAWNELSHWRVLRALHNPRYAGAFVYGQRRTRKTADGRTTTRQLPREQWTTLIPDAHPGYLTWEQFEHNQKLLAANAYAHGSDRAAGPPREGPALLQGLAICGRCGRRMTIRYHQRRETLVPDYRCANDNIQRNGPVCLQLPGHTIDRAIEQLLLRRPSPRSRSRSRSPSKPSSKPAPKKLTSCGAHTSTAPASTPSSLAAAISQSTPTTVSSPTPSKATGTTRCARCRPPKTNTTARPPPPTPLSTSDARLRSASSRPTSLPCGQTQRPRRASANGSPGC